MAAEAQSLWWSQMGRLTMGRRDSSSQPILKTQPEIVTQSIYTSNYSGIQQSEQGLSSVQVLPGFVQERIVEIPVEKQVVVEVPVLDKRTRQHSLLLSDRVTTLAQGMAEAMIAQKNDKSALQMQLGELEHKIMKVSNHSTKYQFDMLDEIKKLSAKIQEVADHKPNVSEIRHIEIKRVSPLLVFLNICLMGTIIFLLCK
jgi:hypothetical protein